MGKESENQPEVEKTAKELAVERLSADNKKWLAAWEKDGWNVDLVDLEWFAEKKFEGDTEKHILTGYSSIVLLLQQIERVESERKLSDAPETDEEKPDEIIEPKIVIRECRVELNDDEVKERHEQMLKTMDEKDETERKFASVKDEHKSTIKFIDSQIHGLRHVCNTRAEWRDVECKEVFNYENWTVTVVRSDTGETVEKRPMTQKERQSKLF